ncbi:Fe-S protein assembly co-chaperone HscB [Arthroderma uncinatum]|uniref:Fe-S protein assembly co-chaperone HscB n=1 Tax=Arthroderma uncinatum TaxID=74035 RepID=UPI00144AED3C|nr:Fe-S protein assembly co-chaperone HscB [Arthroderma uncinatum]KAF3482123.1 Fe-S protein assembly co-chaperone HscB [Arthroderma uncinatum]
MRKSIPSAAAASRHIGQSSSQRPAAFNQIIKRTAQNSGKPCLFCQSRSYERTPYASSRQFGTSSSLPFRNSLPSTSPQSPEAAPQSTISPSEHLSPFSTRKAPDITTHYTIFPKTLPKGPPPTGPFDISLRDLRREFLSLQGLAHPDKYPEGPSKQRAEALSSRINEAYRALGDPLSRAQYLLASQYDIDVTAEDGANKHPQSPETLMQVMDVQEAVEEAEDESVISELKMENEERIAQTVSEMGDAFETGDIDSATKLCSKLKFWYTIRDGLREWEPGNKSIRLEH